MSRKTGLPADKIISEHHHDWARIYLRSDDIVEVHLLPGLYNGKKVLSVIEDIKKVSSKPQLLVLTLTHRRSMSSLSGIQAVFSRPGVEYSMAKAYLFQTRTQFLLANLGHWFFKPKTPIRFFKKREHAESWLKTFQGCGI